MADDGHAAVRLVGGDVALQLGDPDQLQAAGRDERACGPRVGACRKAWPRGFASGKHAAGRPRKEARSQQHVRSGSPGCSRGPGREALTRLVKSDSRRASSAAKRRCSTTERKRRMPMMPQAPPSASATCTVGGHCTFAGAAGWAGCRAWRAARRADAPQLHRRRCSKSASSAHEGGQAPAGRPTPPRAFAHGMRFSSPKLLRACCTAACTRSAAAADLEASWPSPAGSGARRA